MKSFKELFLIFEGELSGSKEDSDFPTDIIIAHSFDEAQEALNAIFEGDNIFSNPQVLHGILTPATVIPQMPKEWLGVWTISLETELEWHDVYSMYVGRVVSSSVETIEQDAAAIIKQMIEIGFDETNAFILYGEEMTVFHSIDEEENDCNLLKVIKDLSNKAKSIHNGERYVT